MCLKRNLINDKFQACERLIPLLEMHPDEPDQMLPPTLLDSHHSLEHQPILQEKSNQMKVIGGDYCPKFATEQDEVTY